MAGSMRRKRRKKLAKAWKEFQLKHGLTDAELKLARSAGHTLDRFLMELESFECSKLPIRQAIALIREKHQQKIEKRKAEIAAGTIKPKAKKKKTIRHDPQWVKAKKLCRLNQDDIRKAKELGIGPKSLIKNIPNRNQQWKLPVKYWINELYEKRFGGKKAAKNGKKGSHTDYVDSPPYTTAFDAYLAGDFVEMHAMECEQNRCSELDYSNSNNASDDNNDDQFLEDIPF